MLVSVLVTTRDRPKLLHRCLASVARQTYSDLEVLVFDDASAVPLRTEDVSVGNVPVRVLRSTVRLGPIEARNRLMRAARGEVFVVLDDDAYLDAPDAIAEVVRTFEDLPRAGILAFKLTEAQGDHNRLLLPHGKRALHQAPSLVQQRKRVSNYLAGAHAVRRRVIAQCGFFRNDLCYGHEELDLSFRAIDAGFEIWYLPEVTAHHMPPEQLSDGNQAWKIYYLTRNRLIVAYTYLPWRYLVVHVSVWMGWYLAHAARHNALPAVWRGIRDGLALLPQTTRRPVGDDALAYLRAHYGRLWF